MERKINVLTEKCIHCGMCINDCLYSCIEFDINRIPKYKEGAEKICLACQHCMAICPTGALSFGGKNPENSTKTDFGNSEDLLNLIKSRRSIRKYKKENISQEKFDKLTRMLPYSPTGGNIDCLHFSIVRTKEKMDEIIKTSYEKIMESNIDSPTFKMIKECYQNGNDVIYRGATSMIAVATDMKKAIPGCETTDPIIALSFLDLYAQSMGLGTLWCDMALLTAKQLPEVYSLLEIPENYTLSYILLLGIPDVKYQRSVQPERFSIKMLK